MNIQLINIDKLLPYINNPRKNLNIDKVASSIKEFGFQQPIVVDKNYTIIVGHTRFEAAKKLGLKEIPVQIADLTEHQARSYRIADNRLNQDATWDTKLLNLEFNDLLSNNIDLDILGFSNDELDNLLLKTDEESDIDLNENIESQEQRINDIKMVQLFFNPENDALFKEAIEKISKRDNIDNISDAVLKAVLNETSQT
jgi:ParB-like chromosome segregation protein Spo0J|tara:strand:+ start:39 stop:635 length:597 start_codon:yes stop_codon:yes gene_type:complete